MPENSASCLHNQCTECGKVFARPEHLRRHMAIHARSKAFICKHCGKSFGRSDAAHRHEQSHLPKPARSDSAHSSMCRTCHSCAKARVRCSGSRPCEFCQMRDLECVYRPRKRRRPLYALSTDQSFDVRPPDQPRSPLHLNSVEDMSIVGGNSSPNDPDLTIPCTANAEDSHNRDVSSIMSTASPATEAQRVEPINWLPFRGSILDQGSFSSQAPHEPQPGSECLAETNSTNHVDEGMVLEDGAAQRTFVNTSTQPNDQFSELIASMLMTSAVTNHESPSTLSGSTRVGRLYADGTGARESLLGRRASYRRQTAIFGTVNAPWSDFAWTSILHERIASMESHEAHSPRISQDVHKELMIRISGFLDHNSSSSSYLTKRDDLVAINTWDYLIQLYFENFDPLYPFLDQSFLALPSWGWALCLATAAMGARYAAISEIFKYGELLSKILHEILLRELETNPLDDSLPFLQARTICTISLCQSRRYDLMDIGNTALAIIGNSSARLRLFSEDQYMGDFHESQDPERAWVAWRFRETRRRTAFFILTTAMNIAFIRTTAPHLGLESLSLLLPSSEELWRAENCQRWFQHRLGIEPETLDIDQFRLEERSRMSLQETLNKVRINAVFPQSMSPFTIEAVIHMLVRRICYAEQYLGDSFCLSSENANTEPQIRSGGQNRLSYSGADPDFARWRNATCDFLDIIHWDALSASARACGLESTVFLSLHLSRLILLSPFKALLAFARSCSANPTSWVLPHNVYGNEEYKKGHADTVTTWWFQDRYKARLALVHAGAMFWHVRRYASKSYVQPFAVYLATIVLWAYGTCANRYLTRSQVVTNEIDGQSSQVLQGSSFEGLLLGQNMVGLTPPIYSEGDSVNDPQSDSRMPSQMQLDRPVDDELVQFFIRHGSIRLQFEGVPDPCDTKGTLQILHEGREILQLSVETWGVTERYVHSLDDLVASIETASWPQTT